MASFRAYLLGNHFKDLKWNMPKFGAQRKMIEYDLFIVSFFKVYFNSIFSHTQKKMGSARFYRISYKSAKNGHDAKRDKGYYGQIFKILSNNYSFKNLILNGHLFVRIVSTY